MLNRNCNLQLSKEIYESFDRNQFTLGVFVDLSKAFDNHQILINKLKYFGIREFYLECTVAALDFGPTGF